MTVNSGGNFVVNDSNQTVGRFNTNTGSSIALNGGTFTYIGANNAASKDQLPTIALNGGSSTIDTINGAGQTVSLVSSSLTGKLARRSRSWAPKRVLPRKTWTSALW